MDRWPILLGAVFVFAGCTAHSQGARLRPDAAPRLESLRGVALLPVDVKAFEIGAGGRLEEKLDWSKSSQDNASKAVIAHLEKLGLTVHQASGDDELRALSHAVFASIVDFTYSDPFPAKMRRFDYSVGPVNALCEASASDAIVVVWGTSYFPTFGRQVMNALVGGPPQQAHLMIAVIDRTGAVLWFNRSVAGGDGAWSTFTNEKGADGIVAAVFSEFPTRTLRR